VGCIIKKCFLCGFVNDMVKWTICRFMNEIEKVLDIALREDFNIKTGAGKRSCVSGYYML